ncbi:sporulation histidine kinase inhibitor Sda [Pueribacillus sp. YX66]|uniref:sporulation histidine kinase inhibitor Sda n=1 Tax=Pueribacillus sp. YX66 TaxID=3229242 RepID=UPI00358D3480
MFENLNDQDLIESYEQSIKLKLEKNFIELLAKAIRQRGLEKYVNVKNKEMVNM